jgi:hypothetical protein
MANSRRSPRRLAKTNAARSVTSVVSQRARRRREASNTGTPRPQTTTALSTGQTNPLPDNHDSGPDPMLDVILESSDIANGNPLYSPVFSCSLYRYFSRRRRTYAGFTHRLSTLASIHLSFVLRATFTRILYRCVSILRCSALDGRTISSKL